MTSETTTIQLSRTTKAKLDKFGKKGETYDQIIRKLLAHVKALTEQYTDFSK